MTIEYLLTKSTDDFCNTKEQFISQLLTNSRLEIKGKTIKFSKSKLSYSLELDTVKHNNNRETVFYFTVSCTEKEENAVETLGEFDALLRRICEEMFVINTIWDPVSMYYAKLLYPKIIEVENMLRKIIYRFMIKTVGSDWYNDATPEDVKKSIKHVQDKNSHENMASDQLYNADFIQLKDFFFKHYSIRQLTPNSFLSLSDTLSSSEDSISVDKLKEFIALYEMKSNWDRYFAGKIQVEDLGKKWEELYTYRNKVAHCKRINKKEYEKANALITELTSAFNACIGSISTIELTNEQTEAVTDQNKNVVHSSLLTAALRESLYNSMTSLQQSVNQYLYAVAIEQHELDDIQPDTESQTDEANPNDE